MKQNILSNFEILRKFKSGNYAGNYYFESVQRANWKIERISAISLEVIEIKTIPYFNKGQNEKGESLRHEMSHNSWTKWHMQQIFIVHQS